MHPAVAQSALAPRKSGLSRFLLLSVVGHAALLGVVLVVSLLSRPAPMDLNQRPIKATLVRLGKPRDQKLLPRKEELPPPPQKTEATPPSPTPAPPPEKVAVAVPIPGVKPTPAPATPKQDGKTDGERRKALFGAFSKVAKAAKPEELEGQVDGDVQGDSAVQEGERYYGLLSAQVKSHYDVSQTIPESERMRLKALVRIRIGKVGELIQAELLKPSGNDLYDAAVLAALKKASPFSPPPAALRDKLQKSGVPLEFSP